MSMRANLVGAARLETIALIVVVLIGSTITPLQILHDWSFAAKYRYDFALFDYAFHVVWHRQPAAALYDTHAEHRWLAGLHYPVYAYQQYVYPPQFAVLLSWLGAIPFRLAAWVWDISALLSWIYTTVVTMRLAHRGQARLPVLLLALMAVSFVPFWTDIVVANSNWLVVTLLSTAIYNTYGPRQRPLIAGIALGLAIVFKITPAVILVIWLARKYWKVAWSTIVTVMVSTVITIAVLGLEEIRAYLKMFSHLTATSMRNGPAPYNSSLKGVLSLWQSPQGLLTPAHISLAFDAYVVITVLLIALVLRDSTAVDARREAAIVSLAPLLLSPLLELPQMMTLYIALAMVLGLRWDDAQNRPVSATRRNGIGRVTRFIAMALVCLDFSSPILQVVGKLVHLPIAYFVGVVSLFGLVLSWSKRANRHLRQSD